MDQVLKLIIGDILAENLDSLARSIHCHHVDENIVSFLDDMVDKTDSSVTFSRVLDLNRDLFLHDHTMGDVPLFLGSTGIETKIGRAHV